jgi:Icc-related predicted phosphoesterase
MAGSCANVDARPDGFARRPLDPVNRIAFVGDWHANLSWACSAVWHAADNGADVIVHCGDFGYQFQAGYLRNLTSALAACRIPLLFVDGNHDNQLKLAEYPSRWGLGRLSNWIWHIPRGFRWTWGGLRLAGLGGAHSVDAPWRRNAGLMWLPQETITDEQAATAIAGGPVDVLVTHDCPEGVTIPGLRGGRFPESEIYLAHLHRRKLRGVVDAIRPRFLWHGHYHTRYSTQIDLHGAPLTVHGLDCDGTTLSANVQVVDLTTLQSETC